MSLATSIPFAHARHELTIHFDRERARPGDNPFVFEGSQGREPIIHVDAPVATIILRLEGARFASAPIEWVAGPRSGRPCEPPRTMTVRRESDRVVVLLDVNTAPPDGEHPHFFHVVVGDEETGRLYVSPDPTIVNHQGPPPDAIY